MLDFILLILWLSTGSNLIPSLLTLLQLQPLSPWDIWQSLVTFLAVMTAILGTISI